MRIAVLALLLMLVSPAGAGWAAALPEGQVPHGTWPLSPRPAVVTGFDPPATRWGAGHRGVDLAGHVGQVVRAALPGRVTFASGLAGRGVVVVDHGDTRTTYEPVVATVRVGDRVARGDPIGRLELPGSHCSPVSCLHWGWRRNADDVYLDPLSLVGAARVRLLPMGQDALVGDSPGTPAPWFPPAGGTPPRRPGGTAFPSAAAALGAGLGIR